MYIDLIVLVVVVLLVIMFFKRFDSFVFAMIIIDLFLKILNFIALNANITELKSLITKYLPSSLANIFTKYTTGVFTDIVYWGILIIYIIFLFYITKIFLKKKKI